MAKVGAPRKTHCKNGHELLLENVHVRKNGDRRCRICLKAERRIWRRRWYLRHQEEVKRRSQEYRDADPERKKAQNHAHYLKRRALLPDEKLAKSLRKYGLTIADREQMRVAQGHGCALCRKTSSTLYVDHDHVTGRVRGLLCITCNTALARVEVAGWVGLAQGYLAHG